LARCPVADEMSPVETLRAAAAELRSGRPRYDVLGDLREPLAALLDAQAEDLALHIAAWSHPYRDVAGVLIGIACGDDAKLAELVDAHSGPALAVARVLLGVPE